MKIAEFASRLMIRLAAIPGLGFLQSYVIEARGMRTRFDQRLGDYVAYKDAATGAAGDVQGAVGGGRRRAGDDVEDDDDEDDYIEYEYDDDSVYADGPAGPVDDYPDNDDYHSYYDDDYRNN